MNVRKTQTGGGPAKTPGDAQSTNNANIVANMRKHAQATAVMQRAGVPGGYPTLMVTIRRLRTLSVRLRKTAGHCFNVLWIRTLVDLLRGSHGRER